MHLQNRKRKEFYDKIEELCDRSRDRDIKTIFGDFNAKVGRVGMYRPAIGTLSLHETSNDNGCRLIAFAVYNNMVVSSTYFPHKNIHNATWKSPDGTTNNQIHHVLVDGRHCSNILNVRSCRGLNIDSRRFDIDKLKTMDVRHQYVENLDGKRRMVEMMVR